MHVVCVERSFGVGGKMGCGGAEKMGGGEVGVQEVLCAGIGWCGDWGVPADSPGMLSPSSRLGGLEGGGGVERMARTPALPPSAGCPGSEPIACAQNDLECGLYVGTMVRG